MSFNVYLFNLLHGLSGTYWPLDWLGIFFAVYFGSLLFLGALVLVFKEKPFKRRFALLSFLILSVVLASSLLIMVRLFYVSPRPFVFQNFIPLVHQDPTNSFPSGHTIVYSALAGAVWVINRKAGYWYLFGAFLIGMARVFAGVHWPSDILGGLVLGVISALVVYRIFPNKDFLGI